MKDNNISDIRESLCLGKFTIHKPEDWDLKNVKVEIQSYDYDSTKIDLNDLKMLHDYIGNILKIY